MKNAIFIVVLSLIAALGFFLIYWGVSYALVYEAKSLALETQNADFISDGMVLEGDIIPKERIGDYYSVPLKASTGTEWYALLHTPFDEQNEAADRIIKGSGEKLHVVVRACSMSMAQAEGLKKAMRANPVRYDLGIYQQNFHVCPYVLESYKPEKKLEYTYTIVIGAVAALVGSGGLIALMIVKKRRESLW